MAVRVLLQVVLRAMADETRLVTVEPKTWTTGTPKKLRRQMIAASFPEYAAVVEGDAGGDLSDAIGLCLWCFRNVRG